MQKFHKILVQLNRNKSSWRTSSFTFRLFTTENVSTDPQKGLQKSIEESHSIEGEQQKNEEVKKLGSFAEAFDRYTAPEVPTKVEEVSFSHMLRHSNLMQLGDPEGKVVVGKVIDVVNNDLYIDFGWKFHCVCPKPIKNNCDYVRGAKVRLRIKDFELSTKFLGTTQEVTLLEADCILLGLISTPNRINKTIDTSSVATQ